MFSLNLWGYSLFISLISQCPVGPVCVFIRMVFGFVFWIVSREVVLQFSYLFSIGLLAKGALLLFGVWEVRCGV